MEPKHNQNLNTAIEQYNRDLHEARATRFPSIPRIRLASDNEQAQHVETVQVTSRRSAQASSSLSSSSSSSSSVNSAPVKAMSQNIEQLQHNPAQRVSLDSAHEKLLTNFSRLRVELTEVLSHLEHQCRLRFEQFTNLKQAIESNRKGLEELYQVKLPADNLDAILNLRKQKKFQLQQELDVQRRQFEEAMLQRRWNMEEEIRKTREDWEQERRDRDQELRLSKQALDHQLKLIEDQKSQLSKVKESELRQLESVYRQKGDQFRQGIDEEEQDLKKLMNTRREEWMREEQEYTHRRKIREDEEQVFLATLALNRKLDQDLYVARKSALEQELEDLKSESEQTISLMQDRLNSQERDIQEREKNLRDKEDENVRIRDKIAQFELTLTSAVEKTRSDSEQTLVELYEKKISSREEAHHLQLNELQEIHSSTIEQKDVTHAREVAYLKSEHERISSLTKDDFEALIKRIKSEHALTLDTLKKEYERVTEELRYEVQKMRQRIVDERDTARQKLIVEHEAQLTHLLQNHRLTMSEKDKRLKDQESLYERRCQQLESRILDLDESNRMLRDRLESSEQKMEELMDNAMRRMSVAEVREEPGRRLPKILRSRVR